MCLAIGGAATSTSGRRSRLPASLLFLLGVPALLLIFGYALWREKLRGG